ncbi:MAG: Asp-tRNA(Asn)/Glu-tRNA(Gln) amidotransferase subunit GatC [Candidatus Yanofskybacteria bacterium]|nr:Asp-tRNA(Asn)/Glu-tRNA(Gln) amidotransferase subunit GatC [Candidatus Yanofskybacteria bacterium]
MSYINKKEVEHIAELARIHLNEKEKEKMASELRAILGYIDKLKEVNTDNVEPIAHITGLENILRKDKINEKPLGEQAADAEKLIKTVPDSKDNFVKVKAIFDK